MSIFLQLFVEDTYPCRHMWYKWFTQRGLPVKVLDREMAQFYMKALKTNSQNVSYVAGTISTYT